MDVVENTELLPLHKATAGGQDSYDAKFSEKFLQGSSGTGAGNPWKKFSLRDQQRAQSCRKKFDRRGYQYWDMTSFSVLPNRGETVSDAQITALNVQAWGLPRPSRSASFLDANI